MSVKTIQLCLIPQPLVLKKLPSPHFAGVQKEDMAKLYFKFGAMGCSKTAQALITKFNYEERGMKVLLVKPSIDNRDGATVVRSRIGLAEEALAVAESVNLYDLYLTEYRDRDVIIVDECQFLAPDQVDQLSQIVITNK